VLKGAFKRPHINMPPLIMYSGRGERINNGSVLCSEDTTPCCLRQQIHSVGN